MKNITLEEVIQTYGVENWGAGYFEVNRKGHLAVRPAEGDSRSVDIKELIDDLIDTRKLQLPILLRFPQILTNQLKKVQRSFQDASREFNYAGGHYGVFPMKVNPRREVVEEFLREGSKYNFGVECGSKAELYAALSLEQTPESLLICNGFKDETFINQALLGVQVGKRVIIVVEKLNELKMIIRRSQETGIRPGIGIRAKLYSKGSGKWASSGGEAARVYSKIRQMHIDVEFLDIGGGMGVDYDGSKTTFESSVNYTIQEFANDVVYTIKSVCDDENVPEPNLVTESGRVMSAYHAVFVTSIRDEIETFADDQPEVSVDEDDPQVIVELKALYDDINAKNYREYYHDSLDHKDELHTQFNLGLISLEDRAKGEVLFWEVCARASRFAKTTKVQEEEFDDLKRILASKYLCNFSVFRSVPDHWAIDQLFPIMPIHRLNEQPTDYATFVDITCDSDGHIDKFVDLKDVKEVLELHPFNGDPYYIAIFLVGAYQEVMGNNHNLFGRPNEAHVIIDTDGRYHLKKIVQGSRVGDMLHAARYDKGQAWESMQRMINARIAGGFLESEEGDSLMKQYESDINRYTYLE